LLNVDLDKGSGEFLIFPRRSCLAGAQAHDHVLPANGLAGMERHVLDNAIALVENSKNGGALRHWRNAALPVRRRTNLPGHRKWRILLRRAFAAGGERKRDQKGCRRRLHAYSGIHGS